MKVLINMVVGSVQIIDNVTRCETQDGMLNIYLEDGTVRFIQLSRINYHEVKPDQSIVKENPKGGNFYWYGPYMKYDEGNRDMTGFTGDWDMSTPENLKKYGPHTKHYGDTRGCL